MSKRIEELAKTLEAALGESPAAAGRRLVSEPELAKLCGVSRQTLRSALDMLIADGFIARRHGSGTYVRKVSGRDAIAALPRPSFQAERIFLQENDDPAAPHELLPGQKVMLIGATEELATPGNRAMLRGIEERVESLGHKLKLIPELTFDDEACLLPDGFEEALRKANCDGYIQMANCRKRFLKGISLAFPRKQCQPVYYVWAGVWTINDCHPLINLDTADSVRLALSKMAANGRKRIAMLLLEHSQWSWIREDMESAYIWSASSLGLSYRATQTVEGIDKANEASAALEKLWSGAEAPDGLYVADDHFLPFVAEWLERKGLKPGRDIGVVTLSNLGQKIDGSRKWSQTRFCQEQTGRLATDLLLRAIQTAGEELCSYAQRPQWIQGETH